MIRQLMISEKISWSGNVYVAHVRQYHVLGTDVGEVSSLVTRTRTKISVQMFQSLRP